jgi:deoxyribose-phosphate aldolase
MYLEFCNYNNSHFEKLEDQTRQIFEAVSLGFSGVAVPTYLLKEVATYFSNTSIDVATVIDFPNGTSDRKIRQHEMLVSLRAAADFIDVPINPYLVRDRKYSKIEAEIKTLMRMCKDYGAEPRMMIQHNLHTLKGSLALARLMQDLGVPYILPASGFHNDDMYDNLVLCSAIEEKTDIKTIFNGHIWLENQYSNAVKSNIFGLRLYSFNLLSSFSV